LLYEATHTHPADQCPLVSAEGKAMLEQLFSPDNISVCRKMRNKKVRYVIQENVALLALSFS
jgi:hypothetical protein